KGAFSRVHGEFRGGQLRRSVSSVQPALLSLPRTNRSFGQWLIGFTDSLAVSRWVGSPTGIFSHPCPLLLVPADAGERSNEPAWRRVTSGPYIREGMLRLTRPRPRS